MSSVAPGSGGRGEGLKCFVIWLCFSCLCHVRLKILKNTNAASKRQFRVRILRACCEKEWQGRMPAFLHASLSANVSEKSFQSTKKVSLFKC